MGIGVTSVVRNYLIKKKYNVDLEVPRIICHVIIIYLFYL